MGIKSQSIGNHLVQVRISWIFGTLLLISIAKIDCRGVVPPQLQHRFGCSQAHAPRGTFQPKLHDASTAGPFFCLPCTSEIYVDLPLVLSHRIISSSCYNWIFLLDLYLLPPFYLFPPSLLNLSSRFSPFAMVSSIPRSINHGCAAYSS